MLFSSPARKIFLARLCRCPAGPPAVQAGPVDVQGPGQPGDGAVAVVDNLDVQAAPHEEFAGDAHQDGIGARLAPVSRQPLGLLNDHVLQGCPGKTF